MAVCCLVLFFDSTVNTGHTTSKDKPVVLLYLFVRWFDSRHEHPVAVNKLHKGVADGVSCTSDTNGFHHTGVPQLTHTQLPVKQLQTQRQGGKRVDASCSGV